MRRNLLGLGLVFLTACSPEHDNKNVLRLEAPKRPVWETSPTQYYFQARESNDKIIRSEERALELSKKYKKNILL